MEEKPLGILAATGDDISKYTGGTIHLLELLEHMARRGHSVCLFAPKLNKERKPSLIDIVYVPVPPIPKLWSLLYGFFLFFVILWHGRARGANLIYTRQFSHSIAPALAAIVLRVPHVLEVNGILVDELAIIRASIIKLWLVLTLSRIDCALSALVIATTEENRKRIISLYRAIPDRVVVVPCAAANMEVFRPLDVREVKKGLGLAEEGFYIGFVGSLYSWHGVDLLLEAFSIASRTIHNATLLIVGSGVELPNLMTQRESLGLRDSVKFLGEVPYERVPLYINACDVCISLFKPTRPVTGVPMKQFEYMACGKPVIASRHPWYGELLERHGAGISVESTSPVEIAKAIKLLAGNAELRQKMGRCGVEAARELYSWERVVDVTLGHIFSLRLPR